MTDRMNYNEEFYEHMFLIIVYKDVAKQTMKKDDSLEKLLDCSLIN